jgi:hypothetical protein
MITLALESFSDQEAFLQAVGALKKKLGVFQKSREWSIVEFCIDLSIKL